MPVRRAVDADVKDLVREIDQVSPDASFRIHVRLIQRQSALIRGRYSKTGPIALDGVDIRSRRQKGRIAVHDPVVWIVRAVQLHLDLSVPRPEIRLLKRTAGRS